MKKIILLLLAVAGVSCSSDSEGNNYTTYQTVSTIATNVFATMQFPSALTMDANGNIYVASFESRIIKKTDKNGVVTTFAGSGKYEDSDGVGETASFTTISALSTDSQGNVYVLGSNDEAVRKITPNGVVSTFLKKSDIGSGTMGIFIDKNDNMYLSTGPGILKRTPAGELTLLAGDPIDASGARDGKGKEARFSSAAFMAMDSKGILYVKENMGAKGIRKVTPDGVVTTLIVTVKKDGVDEIYTNLEDAQGIAIDKKDNIYVSTEENNILQITPDGKATSMFGNERGYKDGPIKDALINGIGRIEFDKNEDLVFIENRANGINIRKISRK
ncbi:hypothetical protein JI750_03380 [Flavobacterium sp. GN10]|uniref:NHL repeat-containing protein n=1 Tax=Flavobacterium tagetis TaxID=2801336 RepID=A0ABS1K9F4_9FLAO|nr:hypothetical protein [Flavobacterium tagetis]MBL0735913.1 hypothetical protein [Flavobacterium tagetis]